MLCQILEIYMWMLRFDVHVCLQWTQELHLCHHLAADLRWFLQWTCNYIRSKYYLLSVDLPQRNVLSRIISNPFHIMITLAVSAYRFLTLL